MIPDDQLAVLHLRDRSYARLGQLRIDLEAGLALGVLASDRRSPPSPAVKDVAKVNAAAAAYATALHRHHRGLHSEFRWAIDRRALEYSPQACERHNAGRKKQLLKFVEDDDGIARRRSLSKSS